MATPIERKLPEELLLNIISLATPACLRSLCRTCKTLNRLATPYLYKDISLGKEDSLTIVLFTYTMLLCPDYANLVTTVTIFQYWGAPDDEKDPKPIVQWPESGPELEKILRRKCAEYAANEDEAENTYDKIASAKNDNALLALLLVHLPNVAKLDISFGVCEDHADFVTVLERFTNQTKLVENSHGPFSSPLDIMVKGTNDRYPNDPENLAVLFNLPNLHAIYGWKLGDADTILSERQDDPFRRLKPRSCPVEYIELRTSKLHKTNLRLLMDTTIPGKLKTFNYEIGCTWAWCNVEHPAIMKSLRAHHNTLQSLGLSHEEYYPYDSSNDDEKPYPVTFKPFKALTRLKVAPVYIWGHNGMWDQKSWVKLATQEMLLEALPLSLEELWITRAEPQDSKSNNTSTQFIPDCLLPALQSVIHNKLQICPELSRLHIEFPLVSWESIWFDALVLLCAAAEANDIRTTLVLTGIFTCSGENQYCERAWGWNENVHWEECVQNHEPPKMWIEVAEAEDLGQMLHGLRSQLVEREEA